MDLHELPEQRRLLWTIDETAKNLSISRRQLERLREQGNFPPAIRFGRSVRFIPAEVLSYLSTLRESA